MPYPRRDRNESFNDASGQAPVAPTVTAPVVTGPQNPRGGAPRIFGGGGGGGESRTNVRIPSPSPFSLDDMETQVGPLMEKIREVFTERMKSADPASTEGSRFWQGFSDYPDAMSKLVARRLLTNRLESGIDQNWGKVNDWLKWLGDR